MRSILAALLLALLLPGAALAQVPEDRTHDELRALRDEMIAAINENDVDRLLTHVADGVVVTWMNGEVSRGKEAVRAYHARMFTGPGALVQTYSTSVEVDDLTILYGGDTGVAFGSSQDHFVLSSGAQLDVDGRWTATVVRQDGRWVVAAFHASAGLFDNPILDRMKTTSYVLAFFGFVMGLTAGLGVALWVWSRRRKR